MARREFEVIRVAYDVIDAVTTRTQLTIRAAPEAHVRNAVEPCLKRLSKLDVPSARRRSAVFPTAQVVSTSWVP
jgi:hypothetical protein